MFHMIIQDSVDSYLLVENFQIKNQALIYNRMGGKKWCEYCRINISYSKKEIQQHQQTRLHLQNKQKCIKFQRIKKQQEQSKKRQENKQNALLSTANIPKAKKGSELEKQVAQYRHGIISSGKAAIHQLIAQKTQGMYGAPIQFPQKQELLIAENFVHKKEKGEQSDSSGQQESEEYSMWRIDICQQTGDPCFINNVTQVKYYEPPKGMIMTEKQKEEWDYLQQICKDKVDVNADNTVNITQWEEVPEEQDFFKLNEIKEQEDEGQNEQKGEDKYKRTFLQRGYLHNTDKSRHQSDQSEIKKTWKDDLEDRLNSNSIDANEVIGTVISHQLQLCKNLKEKNETLKNLVKGGIQIRQTLEEFNKKEVFDQGKKAETVGFKPKKKVKTVKLTEQSDIY